MFPAFSQTYQELSERAVAATEQDSLSLAEKYIEQALKMEPANPHNALLFSNLGTIQRWQHRYEQALDSYTLALNIAPRAIPALMNRAALYLELGKDDLARIDYSLVLDIESDNQEALLMRAYIYMRQRNYNFAKSDYERLLKLAPRSYNGRLGLATLEQKEGKYEAALSIQRFREHDQRTLERQLAVFHDDDALREKSRDAARQLRELFDEDRSIKSEPGGSPE